MTIKQAKETGQLNKLKGLYMLKQNLKYPSNTDNRFIEWLKGMELKINTRYHREVPIEDVSKYLSMREFYSMKAVEYDANGNIQKADLETMCDIVLEIKIKDGGLVFVVTDALPF